MLVGITSLRTSAETARRASESMLGRIGDLDSSIQTLKNFSQESFGQLDELGQELKTIETLEKEIARIGEESLVTINTLSTELKYFRMESGGRIEIDEYSNMLKEIILGHKRIVVSAKALLEGRIEKKNLPDPDYSCPLTEWIQMSKKDDRFGENLVRLEKVHTEFHALYAEYIKTEGKGSNAEELYGKVESRWKELITFREIVNRIMAALQKGT